MNIAGHASRAMLSRYAHMTPGGGQPDFSVTIQ